jgi:hypothetical protein
MRKVPFHGHHALFCYQQGTALLPALELSGSPASETAQAFVAALLHVQPQSRPDARACQANAWLHLSQYELSSCDTEDALSVLN